MGSPGGRRIGGVVALCIAGMALLWPAFENGYLLVNIDTARHLALWIISPIFPQGYNLWLYPWYAWNLPWAVAAAQAALLAALAALTLRWLGAGRCWAAAGLVGFLAAATYAPILASTALPDYFTPIGLLAIALAPLPGSRSSRIALAALLFAAAAVHYSHAPIFLATLATSAALYRLLTQCDWKRFAPAAGALVLAVVMLATANLVFFGRFQYSLAGSVFMLARLQEDGPATEYLRQHCPADELRLCAFVDRLPMDHAAFLWPADAPVQQLGGFLEMRDEASQAVRGAIADHAGEVLQRAAGNAAAQLAVVTISPGRADVPDPWFWEIASLYPPMEAALSGAKQFNGDLYKPRLEAAQRWVILVSALLLAPLSALAVRKGLGRAAAFALTLGAAQLFNALVMAGLSGVENRYQVRVIWLVPLAVAVLALALFQQRQREG